MKHPLVSDYLCFNQVGAPQEEEREARGRVYAMEGNCDQLWAKWRKGEGGEEAKGQNRRKFHSLGSLGGKQMSAILPTVQALNFIINLELSLPHYPLTKQLHLIVHLCLLTDFFKHSSSSIHHSCSFSSAYIVFKGINWKQNEMLMSAM